MYILAKCKKCGTSIEVLHAYIWDLLILRFGVHKLQREHRKECK